MEKSNESKDGSEKVKDAAERKEKLPKTALRLVRRVYREDATVGPSRKQASDPHPSDKAGSLRAGRPALTR